MNENSRRILAALMERPMTYDGLAAELGIPRPSVAGSVNSLNGRGLVRTITTRKPLLWTATPSGARADITAPAESSTPLARFVVQRGGQKTSALGANTSQAATPSAPEADMMQALKARGKGTGHAARARKRAEGALAAGREPGKGGRPARLCSTCGDRHRRGPCSPAARCGGCGLALLPGTCCGGCLLDAFAAGEDLAPYMAPAPRGAA